MADTSASASASTSEGITLEGLKAHSTRDDLWLLINGKVYDVTKFMDEVSWPLGVHIEWGASACARQACQARIVVDLGSGWLTSLASWW